MINSTYQRNYGNGAAQDYFKNPAFTEDSLFRKIHIHIISPRSCKNMKFYDKLLYRESEVEQLCDQS